jgi:hypothetical protein
MGEVRVERVEKGAWDRAVLEAVERLVAPSYLRTPAVLEGELLRCDRLYLASDEEGLLAFSFVARLRLPVGAECRHAWYLGLSASRPDRKGSEAAAAVHARFTADAQLEERDLGVRLVLFTATATPLALRSARQFWADVQPAQDSTFPERLVPVARAAALWLGTIPSAHRPFVLPGLAEVARYSSAERARIAHAAERDELDFFRRLGVEEVNGDRLVLFCSLAARAKGVPAEAQAEAA